VRSLKDYRTGRKISQRQLAKALGVTQAYVSQLESGARPLSRQLAERLGALPDLPPSVVPAAFTPIDDGEADLAADLGALGYPVFAGSAAPRDLLEGAASEPQPAAPHGALGPHGARGAPGAPRRVKNPAAVIISILARRQVAPSVMAGVPWLLLSHTGLDTGWLADQARRRNLQNRLGFLTDLAIELAQARARSDPEGANPALPALTALRADLETSRLANEGTLARVLTPAERQFFEAHRSDAARHWHLATGLTAAQLPYK
jgi:transcriptional regulator with XRE-family HTH domain